MKAQWYKTLFENYGLLYNKENLVKITSGECDFFERELNYNKGASILDIGCGTGRHSIELTKRYYKLTGIDISEPQLKRARDNAKSLNLSIDFKKHDARELPYFNEFDMVIMIYGGAFPLMETDEMNFEILKNAEKALKTNGKLIFTTLNGLFPLFHPGKDNLETIQTGGTPSSQKNSFDLMTFRDYNTTTIVDELGNIKKLHYNERYYVPSEITWLLKSLNFKSVDIYGANLGAFSRNDKLRTDDFEMLVIAEK
jgi:2-polyprenyl-3-methyl-5-hydroxy-6-metoxy-1,4-benzoquinol methylase